MSYGAGVHQKKKKKKKKIAMGREFAMKIEKESDGARVRHENKREVMGREFAMKIKEK